MKILGMTVNLNLRDAKTLAEKIRDGEVKPDPEEPEPPVTIRTMLSKYPCRAEVEYLLFDLRALESLPANKMEESIAWKTKDLPSMFVYCTEHNIDLFNFRRWGISVHHNMWAMIDGVEVRLQDDRNAIEIEAQQ
jgi:hypothetical protein